MPFPLRLVCLASCLSASTDVLLRRENIYLIFRFISADEYRAALMHAALGFRTARAIDTRVLLTRTYEERFTRITFSPLSRKCNDKALPITASFSR